MAWVVGRLDDGHWDAQPETALEWNIAQRFRKENPGTLHTRTSAELRPAPRARPWPC